MASGKNPRVRIDYKPSAPSLELGRPMKVRVRVLVPDRGHLADLLLVDDVTVFPMPTNPVLLTDAERTAYIQSHFAPLCEEAMVAATQLSAGAKKLHLPLRCGAPGCARLILPPGQEVEWPTILDRYEYWCQKGITDTEESTEVHFWYIFCCTGQSECKLGTALVMKARKDKMRDENPDMLVERGCRTCGRTDTPEAPFQRCGRCHVAIYCGKECQTMDWPNHRRECHLVTLQ